MRWRSELRIATSPPITARYERPFTANTHANPTVAIMIPASAGPTILVPVITALFRLTAFVTSSGPTISA